MDLFMLLESSMHPRMIYKPMATVLLNDMVKHGGDGQGGVAMVMSTCC